MLLLAKDLDCKSSAEPVAEEEAEEAAEEGISQFCDDRKDGLAVLGFAGIVRFLVVLYEHRIRLVLREAIESSLTSAVRRS